jgi:hypothetical protein
MNQLITMNNLLLPVLLTGLVSCGGGGGSATVPESPVSQSLNLFKTLVIDGYVEGANVFVDFNFNLIQDEGEPSGVFNSTTYEYEFTESDFGAITNFTETCGLNRPRVAQVPVGAIDSTRGVVNSAYTMMYFPHDGGTPKANVTPFTTMLTNSINDKLSTGISVTDGCGTEANQLAQDIQSELNTVLSNLERNFEIGRSWFYGDFIASEDTAQQSIGEKIVDFLGTLHAIEGLLNEIYNMGFRGVLNDEIVSLILNNTEFDSVTFEIQNETVSTQEGEHFRYNRRHNFYDLRVNSQGQLLDSQDTPIEITLQNLENNSTVLISENYEECKTIISGQDGCDENKVLIVADHLIHISIEERKEVDGYNWNKTFIRFLPADNQGPTLEYSVDEIGRHVKNIESTGSSYEGFELQMLDNANPHFDFDLPLIMSTRYPADLQQIYADLTAIDMTMAGVQGNLYLLYDNDIIYIESGSASKGHQWVYRIRRYFNPNWDQEECEQRDFSDYSVILQAFTGEEAFNVCSEGI